jgi:hypothetical protein
VLGKFSRSRVNVGLCGCGQPTPDRRRPRRKLQGKACCPWRWTAFAFALGVSAGLFIRHTLPAMAVTLAVFTAFPIWQQPLRAGLSS